MNSIISDTTKLVTTIQAGLSRALIEIKELSSPTNAKNLSDELADIDHWMKMKAVQRALGDQFDDARQKLSQLKVQLDLEKDRLAAAAPTEELRRKAYESAGVTSQRIPILQHASRVPERHRDAYLSAKANERTLPKTDELAALDRLPPAAQARAFAKIGDIASAAKIVPHAKSVTAIIRHESEKVLKTWVPSSKPTAPKASEEHLASVQLCSLTRSMQAALSSIFKITPRFQGDKSASNLAVARKELAESLYNCKSKWDELYALGKTLSGTGAI